MSIAQVQSQKATTGVLVGRMRMAALLTQEELADLAGVSPEHISLFEQDLPVPLDSRRRVLRVLWAKKAKG